MIYPSSASHCINVVMPFDEFNTSECQQYGGIISTASNFGPLWKEPLFTDSHENLKTFANSWIIDPNEIKQEVNPKNYSVNPDGSMNVTLSIFFKPQSYFYLGLLISFSIVAVLVLYVVIYLSWRIKKRRTT